MSRGMHYLMLIYRHIRSLLFISRDIRIFGSASVWFLDLGVLTLYCDSSISEIILTSVNHLAPIHPPPTLHTTPLSTNPPPVHEMIRYANLSFPIGRRTHISASPITSTWPDNRSSAGIKPRVPQSTGDIASRDRPEDFIRASRCVLPGWGSDLPLLGRCALDGMVYLAGLGGFV